MLRLTACLFLLPFPLPEPVSDFLNKNSSIALKLHITNSSNSA